MTALAVQLGKGRLRHVPQNIAIARDTFVATFGLAGLARSDGLLVGWVNVSVVPVFCCMAHRPNYTHLQQMGLLSHLGVGQSDKGLAYAHSNLR